MKSGKLTRTRDSKPSQESTKPKSGKFGTGYEEVEKEKQRRDREFENRNKRLFEFYISKDSDGEEITFITDEPITYRAHNIKDGAKFAKILCTQDATCSHCAEGDRASFYGAYVVFHHYPHDKKVYKDGKDTGKTVEKEGYVKVLTRGEGDLMQLKAKKSRKGSLVLKKCFVTKNAKGWNYDEFEDTDVTMATIIDAIPDSIRKEHVTGEGKRADVDWDAIIQQTVDNSEDEAVRAEKLEEYEENFDTQVSRGKNRVASKDSSEGKKPVKSLKKIRR